MRSSAGSFDAEELSRKRVLGWTALSDVYFPNSGIVSLLAAVNGRATLEVGLVGKEGMIGLSVFMGVNSSLNHAVVQGAGSAMRMKATAFRKECNKRRCVATTSAALHTFAIDADRAGRSLQSVSFSGRASGPLAADDT